MSEFDVIKCPMCRGDGVGKYGDDCQLCNGWGYYDPDEPQDYEDVDEDY